MELCQPVDADDSVADDLREHRAVSHVDNSVLHVREDVVRENEGTLSTLCVQGVVPGSSPGAALEDVRRGCFTAASITNRPSS